MVFVGSINNLAIDLFGDSWKKLVCVLCRLENTVPFFSLERILCKPVCLFRFQRKSKKFEISENILKNLQSLKYCLVLIGAKLNPSEDKEREKDLLKFTSSNITLAINQQKILYN